MIPEATLMAILVIVFVADFCSHGKAERKWFNPFVCILLLAQLVINLCPATETVSLFGGIYHATPAASMMKSVLTFGTLVVVLQSRNWLTVTETKRDYAGETDKIQYAFTWFFKEYTITSNKVTNYTGTEEEKTQKYLPVSTKGETLYTPYGKIEFDENGYAIKVNDSDKYLMADGAEKNVSELSVLDMQQKIVAFNADNKLYNFYIVFAPEQLFWSQYFKGDLNEVKDADGNVTGYEDKWTLTSLYKDKGVDLKTITGDWENQMYYSGMDYLGATFRFSATINVLKLYEQEGA